MPRYADVEVGTELPTLEIPVTRADLVRYAGASGDFNVIHWNERVAQSVGLPNVIAHGMFTMAAAGRVVTEWVGDPGKVTDYSVRFSRPVVVADDEAGAVLIVSGVIEHKLDNHQVVVNLTATVNGEKVLGAARATVQLDE